MHKLTQTEFALAVGESVQNVNRWVNGTRKPSDSEAMLRIYTATDGKVTANDFFDLPAPPGINGRHRRQEAP